MNTQLHYNEIAQYNILKCMIHDITVVFHMDDFILCWGSSLPSVFTCCNKLSFHQLFLSIFWEQHLIFFWSVTTSTIKFWSTISFITLVTKMANLNRFLKIYSEMLGGAFVDGGLAIYPLLPSSPTATMERDIQHTVGGVETSTWKHGRDTDFFKILLYWY